MVFGKMKFGETYRNLFGDLRSGDLSFCRYPNDKGSGQLSPFSEIRKSVECGYNKSAR
uniref:Uncharacterized protein n=1 Tax=Rhizophagus irregularis (strain DAOM 181602 / DAOM 197198 / MUCL 43194) TaxID=747089 RepID=U9SUC4_RHIID